MRVARGLPRNRPARGAVQNAEPQKKITAETPCRIEPHFRPARDPAAAPQYQQLAAYAYFGNMIACFMGFGCGHQALAFQGRTDALDLIGTTPEEIPGYMAKAFYAIRDTEALLCFPFGK